jgi:hypothetical protein
MIHILQLLEGMVRGFPILGGISQFRSKRMNGRKDRLGAISY